MYWELTHQAAQAQHQLSYLATVCTPHVACRRQCKRWPISVAPNFLAKRCSSQTAGDLNISNSTILDTIKLRTTWNWLYAARPDALNPLSVMHWTVTKIQLKTWTRFLTLNKWKISQTRSLNHRHLLCRGRICTQAPALRWSIALLRHVNATLRDASRRTYTTLSTTPLRRLKSINISCVGSRRKAWRCTMKTCWRKKTLLWVSQASKMGMASRSSWLACLMIRLLGSGNYTLLRIWDGMTITNALSNSGVEISSKAWDGGCGSQPMPSISFAPLGVASTAICPRNASIPQCRMPTGAVRHN